MKPPRFDRIRCWWSHHKARRTCCHHSLGGNPANTHRAVSWIEQELIDLGRRKRLWCKVCRKVWIT